MPDVTIDVEAWQIDARGRHAAVPYPLAFQGGRIAYSREAVTLEGVDVSVGRSQASRLDAAVGLTGARGCAPPRLGPRSTWAKPTPGWSRSGRSPACAGSRAAGR